MPVGKLEGQGSAAGLADAALGSSTLRGLAIATSRLRGLCARMHSRAMSDSARASGRERLYRFPEELTAEELEQMDRVLDVDGEAYLRWLETGEGPDPCGGSSG